MHEYGVAVIHNNMSQEPDQFYGKTKMGDVSPIPFGILSTVLFCQRSVKGRCNEKWKLKRTRRKQETNHCH